MSHLTHADFAAAVFVKTPGRSPIKTRLARELGTPLALDFYNRACEVMREVLESMGPGWKPYWAVAEAEPIDHRWHSWSTVLQGEGELGQRLHHVYATLLKHHRAVVLLGADAPQITSHLLREAIARVRRGTFVLGPARDGGFYLFAGATPLPASVWTQVQYSQATTREELAAQLRPWGTIETLDELRDVDEALDFLALADLEASEDSGYLSCQIDMISWCHSLRKP
jgi:rSAM/selenodomain-associated transferase 1